LITASITTKHLNPYADLLAACRGDRRYRGAIAAEECLLIGVLAGKLRVVQASHTRTCGPGDTLLLPQRQPATFVKLPQGRADYQAVVLKLPAAWRPYCAPRALYVVGASGSCLSFNLFATAATDSRTSSAVSQVSLRACCPRNSRSWK